MRYFHGRRREYLSLSGTFTSSRDCINRSGRTGVKPMEIRVLTLEQATQNAAQAIYDQYYYPRVVELGGKATQDWIAVHILPTGWQSSVYTNFEHIYRQ